MEDNIGSCADREGYGTGKRCVFVVEDYTLGRKRHVKEIDKK